MKFSLFFEMQFSDYSREKEVQTFHDCVDQAVLADQLGYDCVWAVEHHGLYEYAHCSAPETFLAYVAAKTKNILLGHGVTLLPGKYNHPIRIAERVATLDILSGGRVRWGTGKSGSSVEHGCFEYKREELVSEWDEAVRMIPQMWKDGPFEWKGKHYNIPPTYIVPKPVQNPHPPIFAACSRPEFSEAAGKLGLGVLNFGVYTDEILGENVRKYKEAIAKCNPIHEKVTNHFCCTSSTIVLDDDDKAIKYGLRGAEYFSRSMWNYYSEGERHVGAVKAPKAFPSERAISGFKKQRNAPGTQLSTIIGDPASAIETIKRFEKIGVDEIIFVMQMGTVPHEIIMESIKTVAEKVMPHFK